ncbi:MAG: type II toxin-antitoxin system RelE/ParE family toxin [Nostoc sp.]|uniref:type II toxin-antitoxin system RelE/ParE family toxin n=1 Tax=Nostoc sp. TaxID=1180 RepID=UPI002FFADF6F
MPNEQPSVFIDLTPEYKQNLGDLSKRFRNIRSDVQPIIEQLQQGNIVDDAYGGLRLRIGGIGKDYIIYKVRVRNSSIQKGKSAGYRLIYQVESPTNILLLTIYSKSDQEDIGANQILNIVADFFSQEG